MKVLFVCRRGFIADQMRQMVPLEGVTYCHFLAMLTGSRFDRIIVSSIPDGSENERKMIALWLDEVLPTKLRDPVNGAIIYL